MNLTLAPDANIADENNATPSGRTMTTEQKLPSTQEMRQILEYAGDGPLRSLKGVGPKLEQLLHKLGYSTISKLIFHLPIRHEDHTRITPIGKAQIGQSIIIEGTVESCELVHGAKRYLKCTLNDGSDVIQLIFFQTARYIKERLTPGSTLRCLGTLSLYRQKKKCYTPSFYPVTSH
jgi:ATP-dependent DNA helicase RecG